MLYCADIQHAKIAFFFNMVIFFSEKVCCGGGRSGAKDEFGDVFYVLCVRKHIDGLYAAHLVAGGQEADVAGLCGGVAADVYDASGLHGQELLHHFFVHAGAWRVGYDDVGPSLFGNEVGGEHFGHVAGKEASVV